MAGRKGVTFNTPKTSHWSPEEQLIIAVYIRARQDLLARSKKRRREAEDFFRLEGLDLPKSLNFGNSEVS
jgi:hypothetical protein